MLKDILKSDNFNTFFSFMLGLGLICIIRPMCSGPDCSINKPPLEKDFDKYVYRFGSKCYKFNTKITECPAEGTIEAFQQNEELFMGDSFLRRRSNIGPVECE